MAFGLQRWITIVLGSVPALARATTSIVRLAPLCRGGLSLTQGPAVYNFLQYSSAYTLFLFLTLLIAQVPPLGSFPSTRPYPGVDGQQLAILALSFLFLCFTGSLFAAHTRLILRNMTTIEEIGMNRMRQRERKALTSTFGFWAWRYAEPNPCAHLRH